MLDTAGIPQDGDANRSYADWAGRQSVLPGFIHRRASGAANRFQAGGLGNMALFLCALSLAGLAGITFATLP